MKNENQMLYVADNVENVAVDTVKDILNTSETPIANKGAVPQTQELKKFEVGKIYYFVKSKFGKPCKEMYKVVKRTKKRIIFQYYDPDFDFDEDDVIKCKTEDIQIITMKYSPFEDYVDLPSPTESIWLGEPFTPRIHASDEEIFSSDSKNVTVA